VTLTTRRRRAAGLLTALALPMLLAACARSPATGERIFTGGMSLSDEKKIGREQHPQLVQQFGGEFDEPKVTNYVSNIGRNLARRSELPGLEWEFTVIDSPIVNAFALPGGYIHVTRRLVGLAENEAELAGVLGHEIGHVTARHSAERYGGSVLANVAGIASAIFLGRQAADAIGTLSTVALRGYSRSQELEADKLGVRYLRQNGYNPNAMASFLKTLQADSRLQAVIQGLPEDAADQFNILQTHPRTSDRVKEAIAAAGGRANGELGRERYLEHLDGMRFGGSREQGFVRATKFLHPELGFAFEVPEGFRLMNRPDQVAAIGPDNTQIIFTTARPDRRLDADTYLTDVWAKNARLRELERIRVNGKPAAVGLTRVRTQSGRRDLRLVAVRWDERRFYRFMFATPPSVTGRYNQAFRRTTHSLRELGEEESANLQPLRLEIHTVRAGETVASLAEQLPYGDFKERRFRVLNAMDEGDELAPGDKVKLVTASR
jgi:predicted Zn-dependent protease